MSMTLTQFINTYKGTKVDYKDENFKGDGSFQCVDLARQYYKDVLNVPQFPALGANGGAKDIIKNPGKLKVIKEDLLADYSAGLNEITAGLNRRQLNVVSVVFW